ncbi:MAG: SUF system NifU family Fe-S cluster assembly protein [Candidatus Taylorbacteria bacterium]|nr:SUF system NifU family Fe-S cluster assembly protein [Candidatus Taylorbacteria bacterium]
MTEGNIEDLYREIIIDHCRNPRNYYVLENAHRKVDGHNPLCGDSLTVYLNLENGVIQNISFQGSGCAISRASASLMTRNTKGKTVEDAEKLFNAVHLLVTKGPDAVGNVETLGELAAFSGVYKFPSRVKCATLAWQALIAALRLNDGTVTTE